MVVVGQHKHEEGQFHKEWISAVEYIVVVEERQDLVVIVAVVDVVKAIKLNRRFLNRFWRKNQKIRKNGLEDFL